MKINIGAGIQFRSGLARDVYAAGGVRPEFVGDFTGGVYRVDSAASTFADAFTFARTGTATFVDADGILQTAADGVARTGHHIWNGSEWAGPFLQLESEARTNDITHSTDFTNASWTKSSVTVASEATASPISATTSSKITPTGSGAHFFFDTITLTANTYTQSIYAKAFGYNFLFVDSFGDGTLKSSCFNLSTGAIVSEFNATASIESMGNGWYRCSSTFLATAASHTVQFNPSDNGIDNDFVADGTSAILAVAPQMEVGSTPSSYIPTTGTTATRNAETLTIAAADAPWPEPVVIGPELVTNGTFDTDIDGWATAGPATATWNAAGYVDLDRNGGGSNGQLGQDITTVVGQVYELSFEIIALSNSVNFDINSADFENFTSTGVKSVVFVASTTTTNIQINAVGSVTATASIDNISVREINPLAVSIQMEGTVTYADTDSAEEVLFLEWRLDANNEIYTSLQTNGTQTGRLLFAQLAGGIGDFLPSGDNVYSPGINVPFNIASRHGSTFINGAVNGTALTADLTPTALPDLSATDVQIGPDFMGSIGRIVIWADDIADAGIAAASA